MSSAYNDIAIDLGNAFHRAGFDLYLVGGSVRDVYFGTDPKDLDFTTDARPDDIKDILRSTDIDALWTQGEAFGTIGAKYRGRDVEITTFRSDQYRQGDRKPDVTFGNSIEEDLARRDFTMNAMAVKLTPHGRFTTIDPHGGMIDLRAGVVRFVGHPKSRIMEDPLRMLRAIRFASTLDMKVDSEASYWIMSQGYMLSNISQERISDELSKMLLTVNPSAAINELKAHDLLQIILPEIANTAFCEQDRRYHSDNVYGHTMRVLDSTNPRLDLRLAALFHDSGKVETRKEKDDGSVTFYRHEKLSASIASAALRRLHFPNDIRGRVVHMCAMHMRPLSLVNNGLTRKAVRKFIRDCYDNKYGVTVWDVLELNKADCAGHKTPDFKGYVALRDAVTKEQSEAPVQELDSPLDGHEILALFPGRTPGPWVGELKKGLTEEVVCGRMEPEDKEAAQYYVFNQSMLGY